MMGTIPQAEQGETPQGSTVDIMNDKKCFWPISTSALLRARFSAFHVQENFLEKTRVTTVEPLMDTALVAYE